MVYMMTRTQLVEHQLNINNTDVRPVAEQYGDVATVAIASVADLQTLKWNNAPLHDEQ